MNMEDAIESLENRVNGIMEKREEKVKVAIAKITEELRGIIEQ